MMQLVLGRRTVYVQWDGQHCVRFGLVLISFVLISFCRIKCVKAYSWEFLVGVCRPVLQILTRFQTKNGVKNLPDGAAHTYIAYKREFPPPGDHPILPFEKKCKWKTNLVYDFVYLGVKQSLCRYSVLMKIPNAIGAVFLLLLVRCGSTHEEALKFVQKLDCKTKDSREIANQSTVTVRHKLLSGRVS